MTLSLICRRCKVNARDTKSFMAMCAPCRKAYHREYRRNYRQHGLRNIIVKFVKRVFR